MKQLLLLAMFSIAAVLNINTAFAQNAHFIKGPCLSSDGRTLTGTIAGLGEGTILVEVNGIARCVNPGDQQPPAWDNLSISQPFNKTRGGNFKLNISLTSDCNRKWTFETENLTVSVWANGTEVITDEPVAESCN